jgi:hypothetical protein
MSDNNSQAYRREADRLLSLITALTDDGQQLELFQMARQYVKMAERVERREGRAAPNAHSASAGH